MDMTKEEILGSIQRLYSQVRQKRAFLRNELVSLKELDDELPAAKEMAELREKLNGALARLKTERAGNSEWQKQNTICKEAKVDLQTFEDSLSDHLTRYMVKTKTKAVHAVPSEPAEVDREIVMAARVGGKVAANLSLFDDLEVPE